MLARRDQTRIFAEYFLRHVTLPKGTASLLDVGCAYGDALKVFRDAHPLMQLTGVDRERDHIEAARSLLPTFEFLESGLNELPQGRRWDAIYCSNVLEHLYRKEALRAVRALLAHCSTLYVVCPFLDSTAVVTDDDGNTGANWEGHRWILNEHSLRCLHGVDVQSVVYDTPGAWQFKQIAFTIRKAAQCSP